jgi:transposase InsO family protein
MPWKEYTCMSQRHEFVTMASQEDANVSALCRTYGISRKTAYKLLGRFTEEGLNGLKDQSRRPHASPMRTVAELEARVCALRELHPAWGGRKLHHRLLMEGVAGAPAPSTITGILARHGLLRPDRRLRRDWQRFEHAAPNDLWQMDFKGHFATAEARCHPLTVLDDHSRFCICLTACPDERGETVRRHLSHAFERYGLPWRMLMDNGAPWGSDEAHRHTKLTAWLIRLGISVSHGRPYHPQTQGKEERFHRTLVTEVLAPRSSWTGLHEVQQVFDPWRDVYNLERPHEALGHQTPVSRYVPSWRAFPAALPAIEYEVGDQVRRVDDKGYISFCGQSFLVSRAFTGEPVALRAKAEGVWDVYYCHHWVTGVDLTSPLGSEV